MLLSYRFYHTNHSQLYHFVYFGGQQKGNQWNHKLYVTNRAIRQLWNLPAAHVSWWNAEPECCCKLSALSPLNYFLNTFYFLITCELYVCLSGFSDIHSGWYPECFLTSVELVENALILSIGRCLLSWKPQRVKRISECGKTKYQPLCLILHPVFRYYILLINKSGQYITRP